MTKKQLRLFIPEAKCNLSCSYCLVSEGLAAKRNPIVLDVKAMLSCIDHPFEQIDRVGVWGGEVLTNLSMLEELLAVCQSNFKNAQISLVSNGYLLDKRVVSLLNRYKVTFLISHDGPGQFYRNDKDFLRSKYYLDLLEKIDYGLGFHSVLHHDNSDVTKIYHYFSMLQKNLSKPFFWNFGFFKANHESLVKFIPHNDALHQLHASYLFLLECYERQEIFAITALKRLINSVAIRLFNNELKSWFCGSNNWITVDITGKRYLCQAAAENKDEAIPEVKTPLMCSLCEVKNICGGICPKMHDSYRALLCPVYKMFYFETVNFLEHLLNTNRQVITNASAYDEVIGK